MTVTGVDCDDVISEVWYPPVKPISTYVHVVWNFIDPISHISHTPLTGASYKYIYIYIYIIEEKVYWNDDCDDVL